PAAVVPVGDQEPPSVGRDVDAQRPQLAAGGEELLALDDLVGAAGAFDDEARDMALAPLAVEQIAAVLLRQGVLVVTDRAAGGAAAVLGHPPQRVVLARLSAVALL